MTVPCPLAERPYFFGGEALAALHASAAYGGWLRIDPEMSESVLFSVENYGDGMSVLFVDAPTFPVAPETDETAIDFTVPEVRRSHGSDPVAVTLRKESGVGEYVGLCSGSSHGKLSARYGTKIEKEEFDFVRKALSVSIPDGGVAASGTGFLKYGELACVSGKLYGHGGELNFGEEFSAEGSVRFPNGLSRLPKCYGEPLAVLHSFDSGLLVMRFVTVENTEAFRVVCAVTKGNTYKKILGAISENLASHDCHIVE